MTQQRTQNVYRSLPIQIGDSELPVSFKLNHSRQFVRCAVKGKKPFRVYMAYGKFEAAQRGTFRVAVESDPASAFAAGVNLFWRSL